VRPGGNTSQGHRRQPVAFAFFESRPQKSQLAEAQLRIEQLVKQNLQAFNQSSNDKDASSFNSGTCMQLPTK
jgi:hypothetical protein